MSGFNDFVQTELPLRPFVRTDGQEGQTLVRSNNPLAPREMVWATPDAAYVPVVTSVSGTDWVDVDQLDVGSCDSWTWRVQVTHEPSGSRISAAVMAMHNGISAPPTDVSHTVFGKLQFGGLICLFDVVLANVQGSDKLILRAKTSDGSTVKVWRMQGVR